MKRFIVCSLFLLLGVATLQAKAPWGLLGDYVNLQQPSLTGSGYLMRKVLAGQPIYVKLNRESGFVNPRYDDLSRQIAQSYNKWFSNAQYYIEKQHREEEFADILPLLRDGIKVQVTDQNYDIRIFFLPSEEIKEKCQNEQALGCYYHDGSVIFLPTDDFFITISLHGIRKRGRIGLHEIGHSLGLSDQYLGARVNNSDERHSSMQERKSVMNQSGSLTCDDADGIINLIDVTQGNSRGGKQGWKSLCSDSQEYYVGGVPAGKGPYQIRLLPGIEEVEVATYQGEKQVAFKHYPFDIPQGAVPWKETTSRVNREFDRLKRPVRAEGLGGETIYYAYLYDRTIRVAIRDEKVLNYVEQQRAPKKYTGSYRNLLFGQKGAISWLHVQKRGKNAFNSQYSEGANKTVATVLLQRQYDEKGKLTEDYVSHEPAPMAPLASGNRTDDILSLKIARQVEARTQDEQHKRLAQQLESWSRKTLKELEDPLRPF